MLAGEGARRARLCVTQTNDNRTRAPDADFGVVELVLYVWIGA